MIPGRERIFSRKRSAVAEIRIIHEDETVLVVDKPAGIAVHRGVNTEATVADWFVARCPDAKEVGSPERPGIVHRLDKGTSGIMVLAKTKAALEFLQAEFKAREAKKEYVALVYGAVRQDEGEITLPIGRSGRFRTKRSVTPSASSKPAQTSYVVELRFTSHTLLKVLPFTGRTHQIRVHLAAINHPIVGDTLYATKPYRDAAKEAPRLFLHARALELTLPSRVKKRFETDLPKAFASFIAALD